MAYELLTSAVDAFVGAVAGVAGHEVARFARERRERLEAERRAEEKRRLEAARLWDELTPVSVNSLLVERERLRRNGIRRFFSGAERELSG